MPGFTRIHGNTVPNSVYGWSPRYLKIDTGNVIFSATPGNVSYYGNTLSSFEKAVFAIGSVASIITLGAPLEGGTAFVVQVDSTYGEPTGTTTNLALAVKAAINASVVTVTESTGFAGGAFVAFA